MRTKHVVACLLLIVSLVVSLGLAGSLTESKSSAVHSDIRPVSFTNSTIELGDIRVHALELTRSRSAWKDHVVTSVLFMVEDLGDDDIESHTNQTLNFSDGEGNRISIPVGGCPKSGTISTPFDNFVSPWHIEIPNPANNSRTRIVRHWMCHEIPSNARKLDVSFGRTGQLVDFTFGLERK